VIDPAPTLKIRPCTPFINV